MIFVSVTVRCEYIELQMWKYLRFWENTDIFNFPVYGVYEHFVLLNIKFNKRLDSFLKVLFKDSN